MKTAKRKSWNNESGQGLVEYLLVLVVTIILVLGLMAQFYKPFNQWITNYMGPYLSCLLDVGELPTFGSAGDSGLCATEFNAGNGIYSKTTPIAGTNSSSSSGGTENNSTSNSNSSNSSRNGGGSSASSGSSSRMKGFSTGKAKGADGPSQGDSGGMVPLAQTKYFRASGGVAGEVARRSGNVVGIAGMTAEEKEKTAKENEKVFNAGGLDGSLDSKNKKLELKEPERKIASEEKDTPWSFSSYLKFAVILMIIIAIVLFLGGQILQISKSMEK